MNGCEHVIKGKFYVDYNIIRHIIKMKEAEKKVANGRMNKLPSGFIWKKKKKLYKERNCFSKYMCFCIRFCVVSCMMINAHEHKVVVHLIMAVLLHARKKKRKTNTHTQAHQIKKKMDEWKAYWSRCFWLDFYDFYGNFGDEI